MNKLSRGILGAIAGGAGEYRDIKEEDMVAAKVSKRDEILGKRAETLAEMGHNFRLKEGEVEANRRIAEKEKERNIEFNRADSKFVDKQGRPLSNEEIAALDPDIQSKLESAVSYKERAAAKVREQTQEDAKELAQIKANITAETTLGKENRAAARKEKEQIAKEILDLRVRIGTEGAESVFMDNPDLAAKYKAATRKEQDRILQNLVAPAPGGGSSNAPAPVPSPADLKAKLDAKIAAKKKAKTGTSDPGVEPAAMPTPVPAPKPGGVLSNAGSVPVGGKLFTDADVKTIGMAGPKGDMFVGDRNGETVIKWSADGKWFVPSPAVFDQIQSTLKSGK